MLLMPSFAAFMVVKQKQMVQVTIAGAQQTAISGGWTDGHTKLSVEVASRK